MEDLEPLDTQHLPEIQDAVLPVELASDNPMVEEDQEKFHQEHDAVKKTSTDGLPEPGDE